MHFLPISILAYALNGGAILINKIQLHQAQLNPYSYTFYSGLLQVVVIVFAPFGFNLQVSVQEVTSSILSGVIFMLALFCLYKSLQLYEASVAGPVITALNPFVAFLLGGLILDEVLTPKQIGAFFILMIGAVILTANLWFFKLRFSKSLFWMISAGAFFGLSYVFLRDAFLQTSFINGLIISRLAAVLFTLSFLLIPKFRVQIVNTQVSQIQTKDILILFLLGQAMAGFSHLLLFLATSFANPALVNSLFGVQYLIILGVALLLSKKAPRLLGEHLSKLAILQKAVGAVILSYGVYLLSK